MVRSITRWWQHADQFDWFSAYLDERGLQNRWRGATFIFTALLAVIPVALIRSPTGPDHPVTVTASVCAALSAGAGGLVWLTRWPTRRQSTLFALLATAAIATTCLSQSNPYSGLVGCTTFAVIGGFVAYFHTVALLSVNLAAALICAAATTYRLVVNTGDIALAASACLIVLALNTGVPFGIHSLTHTLRRDLRSSGHDPLTGLLNRRSFYHSAYELLMRGRDGAHLVVVLIDLDNFKKLNDTRGHAVGDQALAEVGSVLRDFSSDTAVIGRIGGEEFVIADSGDVADLAAFTERLRHAIATMSVPVTASIGTAAGAVPSTSTAANLNLIDSLIDIADAAMYEAKRAGGDRVCHSAPPGGPDPPRVAHGR